MALIIAHLLPALPIAYCGEEKICSWSGFRSRRIPEAIRKQSSSWNPTISSALFVESPALGPCSLLASSNLHNGCSMIEIPVTCYKLIGLHNQAEKDEIVKAAMLLKNADVEEGYTVDAVVSRQELLIYVRDKLLFEPEYAGDARKKVLPKEPLHIPLHWFPGAICLLQEVGEARLVLDFGRKSLQNLDVKPYTHDLVLSMALAECAVAKICFESEKLFLGFEALAHAQLLLRNQESLEKMALLAEIEDSLEALAPACILEILGIPRLAENSERRRGAITALCELLRQGLDVETSCLIKDWPDFLSQALSCLTAQEIVDLLRWDDLALARRNKKLFESQNQRAMIDVDCFYTIFLAHAALGFSDKRLELIGKAKTICNSLIASDAADMKFEEVLCSFLLMEINETETIEQLQQLNLVSNSTTKHLSERSIGVCAVKPLAEKWLKDVALHIFLDTRDCLPSLDNFFKVQNNSSKNSCSGGALHVGSTIKCRELSATNAISCRDSKEIFSRFRSSDHLDSFLTPLTSNSPNNPTSDSRTSGSNDGQTSLEHERHLLSHYSDAQKMWFASTGLIEKLMFVMFLGFIGYSAFKLSRTKFTRLRASSKSVVVPSLLSRGPRSLNQNERSVVFDKDDISGSLRKLLARGRGLFRSFEVNERVQSTPASTGLSSFKPAVSMRQMAVEEAEALVKQWQSIKSEALGPNHHTHGLLEILDEAMLVQWQSLADAAKEKSSFWRFVLLQLSILHADISLNARGTESAEILAHLEEVAELVGASSHKNPNYYSTYKIHYFLKRRDNGAWVFCSFNIVP